MLFYAQKMPKKDLFAHASQCTVAAEAEADDCLPQDLLHKDGPESQISSQANSVRLLLSAG